MKRLIDRRNVELDPGLAKGYLVYNTYEMQRVRLDLEWAEILSPQTLPCPVCWKGMLLMI